MREYREHDPLVPEGKASLDTADAIARAVQLCIRSLCLTEHFETGHRQALAGGLIAGLCEHLDLDPRLRHLINYVYALLDDEGSQALSISRTMLDRPASASARRAFDRGRDEAAAIVEILAYHGN